MVCSHVLVAVALLVAGGVAAGCGGDGGQRAPTPASRPAPQPTVDEFVSLPAAILRRCAALASGRDVAVLCPTRLPKARWKVAHQTLRGGRLEYLIDLETNRTGSGDPFHVLAGGRHGRFLLNTTNGKWPTNTGLTRDLGLVGAKPLKPGQRHEQQQPVRLKLVRRSTVGEYLALLLEVADYPDGGVHGGHLAVVWNQQRDGYVLSMHFAEQSTRTRPQQEAVLHQTATAMSRLNTNDAG
jgi:hypothetical protein